MADGQLTLGSPVLTLAVAESFVAGARQRAFSARDGN